MNSLKQENNFIKGKKIYVTRRNCSFRNLINEFDILTKLEKEGFQYVNLDELDIYKQIKIFSKSEIIVSPTGSNLTNLVFCNKGAKIFEISPKYKLKYEDVFKNRFSNISKTLGLEYHRIEADSVPIKKIDLNIKETIHPDILSNSNYYKNLLVKKNKIDQLNKF